MDFKGTPNERLKGRAQEISSMMELHYRAEFAEALLSEKPAPRSPVPEEWLKAKKLEKTPPSPAQLFVKRQAKLSARQRKDLAKRIMTQDLRTGRLLSESDRETLQKLIEPNSDTPMLKRTKLDHRIIELLKPPKEFKPGNPKHIWKWAHGVFTELSPDAPRFVHTFDTEDDGRPDDDDPDNPPDQDEPGPSTPTPGPAAPTTVSPGYEALQLHIERVRCLRETRGEAGRDEIEAGGVAVDGPLYLSPNPSDANGTRFGRDDLDKFRTGEQRVYSPTVELHEWDLTDKSLPHLFMAWFTLAETDPAAGFSDYLNDLETSIMAEIASYEWSMLILAYVFGAMAGLSLGLLISAIITGPIGIVILAITALALSVLDMLLALGVGNRDDIFELRELIMPLTPATLSGDPFHGNARSTTQQIIIEGDGGRYQIDYFWQLVGQIPAFTVFDDDLTFLEP